ncbi:MAG: MarR family winged helix-turn-helix transcriptional regulator [Solirubrobacteraceae bacterium]
MPASATSAGPAAREAWGLIWRMFVEDKPRRWAILSELGLSMQQSMALTMLRPGEPLPMSALAEAMHCDNSNVTGIVDRLEAAGLAERRPGERDRRVKTIALTPRGEAMRAEVERRAGEPPPRLAALPAEDAAALRDILARAMDR